MCVPAVSARTSRCIWPPTPPVAGFPAPLDGAKGALYRVNGQDGIRIGKLWSYYNLYKELNKEAVGAANNPQLQSKNTLVASRLDPFFYFKRPVVISYKALFSSHIPRSRGRNGLLRLIGVRTQGRYHVYASNGSAADIESPEGSPARGER